MSDNLETSIETQEQILQPVDAVAADTEESGTPTTANDEIVIDVEEQESSQDNNAHKGNDSAIYVRMKKEKEKRKKEHEARLAAEQRESELQERIKQLESAVNPIVNPKPTIESCDYDSDKFAVELDAYYKNQGNAQPVQQQNSQSQAQQSQFDEQTFEADYYLKNSEEQVIKSYPNYSQEKGQLLNKFNASGGNEQTFIHLSSIASQAGIDIAKANIALNRNDELFNSLINAAGSGNQFAVADILKKAASKVNLRTSKKVDTTPTPDIKNSGPIDNHSALVEKTKKAWMESGSTTDYKAYKAAKKAANA